MEKSGKGERDTKETERVWNEERQVEVGIRRKVTKQKKRCREKESKMEDKEEKRVIKSGIESWRDGSRRSRSSN